MSFNKDVDVSFPDPERRHFTPDSAPRAARCTLGPGLMPVDQEPEAWQHHISRSHAAHTNRNAGAVLPNTGITGGSFGDTQGTGTASFAGATAGGQSVGSAAADSRWQSSYQAHTLGDALNDGVGTVAKRRGGKKQMPRPGEQSVGSPFATGATQFARSNGLVRESENTVHDGTTKNSAHVPGYSGHVPTYAKQAAMRAPNRVTHDKALFGENYASQMKTYGGIFR